MTKEERDFIDIHFNSVKEVFEVKFKVLYDRLSGLDGNIKEHIMWHSNFHDTVLCYVFRYGVVAIISTITYILYYCIRYGIIPIGVMKSIT